VPPDGSHVHQNGGSGGPTGPSPGSGAYEGFRGRVGRTFAGSRPDHGSPPIAPAGAPNVIVILVDDLGYSDLGCFGSEIATPNLDALAQRGVRYTNFHVTPMCSPTRAALLTGLNSHLAGVGHVAHSDPGYPGYAMELTRRAATAAEVFRDAGWDTFMVGKWHLTKDSNCSDAGPRDSWPCQRGFDRFYGILDGFTNLHHPHRIVRDNSPVEVDTYPEGYYFTDDLTDRAIEMIRSAKASNPSKPFFCYLAHAAAHAPLHAKSEDIARYADRYHGGWDRLRAERFARLRELGVVDEGTLLPPRNHEAGSDVAPWDSLSEAERRINARYMAVYAAMVDSIDQSTGRLVEELRAMGELDDTIILFTSDNGASREGEVEGTTGYYVHLLGETDLDADLARLDEIGGPTTIPHYPRGWAMACNTPFRLYKINTHAGGHQVPAIFSWPRRFPGGGLRRQYVHVTDVMPTLLELAGLRYPDRRGGEDLLAPAGSSFAQTVSDPEARSRHTEQHYEMLGHRGYYRDGKEIVSLHRPMTPFGDHEFELYDLEADPTETNDLAGDHPELVAELSAAWNQAAWDNQVFPLDEGSGLKYLDRPGWVADAYDGPVTIRPGTPTLERWRSQRLVLVRSFDVEVRCSYAEGDEGILVAHGDQGGGYLIWVEGGAVHVGHNDGRGRFSSTPPWALVPGDHVITAHFHAPGGNVWDVTLSIDGSTIDGISATGWSVLFPMAPFEGIDVGRDRRSPVCWRLYRAHGSHPYRGVIESVTYRPGDPAPDSPASLVELLREMGARYE
jgi:arylsulfatase A-like enzyme